MNNIIKFLESQLPKYTSHELYGIFFNGKRISSFTDKKVWTSHSNAKKALHYILNYFKIIDFENGYYTKYGLTNEEFRSLTVDKLLKDGIFEIKEVENT